MYTTDEYAILLRALLEFIQLYFPDVTEMILAVTETNITTQTLYQNTGFERLENIVQGEFGPLNVMNIKVNFNKKEDSRND